MLRPICAALAAARCWTALVGRNPGQEARAQELESDGLSKLVYNLGGIGSRLKGTASLVVTNRSAVMGRAHLVLPYTGGVGPGAAGVIYVHAIGGVKHIPDSTVRVSREPKLLIFGRSGGGKRAIFSAQGYQSVVEEPINNMRAQMLFDSGPPGLFSTHPRRPGLTLGGVVMVILGIVGLLVHASYDFWLVVLTFLLVVLTLALLVLALDQRLREIDRKRGQ